MNASDWPVRFDRSFATESVEIATLVNCEVNGSAP